MDQEMLLYFPDNTSPLTNPLAADGTSGSHGYGTVPSTSRGISITSPSECWETDSKYFNY